MSIAKRLFHILFWFSSSISVMLHAGSYHTPVSNPEIKALEVELENLRCRPQGKGKKLSAAERSRMFELDKLIHQKKNSHQASVVIGSVLLKLPEGMDFSERYFYFRVCENHKMPSGTYFGDGPIYAFGMSKIEPGKKTSFNFSLPQENYWVEILMMNRPLSVMKDVDSIQGVERLHGDTSITFIGGTPYALGSGQSRSDGNSYVIIRPRGVYFTGKSTSEIDAGHINYLGHIVFEIAGDSLKLSKKFSFSTIGVQGSCNIQVIDESQKLLQDPRMTNQPLLVRLIKD